MFWKPLKVGILGLSVALTCSIATWKIFGQVSQQYAMNVPLAYTLISWNARSLAPDNREGHEVVVRGARRSDGSTVRASYEMDENGNLRELRGVRDLEMHRFVIVDSSLKSVTTTHPKDQTVDYYRHRRPACNGETVTNILGYEVIRRVDTGPEELHILSEHGRLRVESLIAPALGCLELEQKLIMTYDDGSERPIRLVRVVEVRLGEPDEALFNVPSDYIEMSPVDRLTASDRDSNISNDLILQIFQRHYNERSTP